MNDKNYQRMSDTAKRNIKKAKASANMDYMTKSGEGFHNWQTEHPAYYGVGYSEKTCAEANAIRAIREAQTAKRRRKHGKA